MNPFDNLVYEVGSVVIGGGFLALLVWLAYISDYFRYLTQIVILLTWLTFTTGACIYAALFIHLHNQHIILAILTASAAALLFIPWYSIAYPAMKDIFRRMKQGY